MRGVAKSGSQGQAVTIQPDVIRHGLVNNVLRLSIVSYSQQNLNGSVVFAIGGYLYRVAEHKLNQIDNQLNQMGTEGFIHRHLSTFSIITISIIVMILIYITCCKCRFFRRLKNVFNNSGNDPHPKSTCFAQIFN